MQPSLDEDVVLHGCTHWDAFPLYVTLPTWKRSPCEFLPFHYVKTMQFTCKITFTHILQRNSKVFILGKGLNSQGGRSGLAVWDGTWKIIHSVFCWCCERPERSFLTLAKQKAHGDRIPHSFGRWIFRWIHFQRVFREKVWWIKVSFTGRLMPLILG